MALDSSINGAVIETEIDALLSLLSNSLILSHTAPYLPVTAVLNLAATSRSFRDLIYSTPQVFRYLDLTQVRSAKFHVQTIDRGGETWRNVQLDENLTEDEYVLLPFLLVASPLRCELTFPAVASTRVLYAAYSTNSIERSSYLKSRPLFLMA